MKRAVDRKSSHRAHPADFNRALRCFGDPESFDTLLKAAAAGCVRAQFLAGLAYHTGRGVERNYNRAAAWYRMAAGSGDGNAITNLGVMSLLGQGAPADDLDAFAWVQSAVSLGHRWLRPALAMLQQRITGAGEAGDSRLILASLSPEVPALLPCTQPSCDSSRCSGA